jgi:regulator of cell morphogenesis and NO signaling
MKTAESIDRADHGARRKGSEPDWRDYAPWELVTHLLATYHPYVLTELPRLLALARDLRRAHGDVHGLDEIEELLGSLRADLEPHVAKEQRVLFPYVLGLEVHDAEGTTPPAPPFGSLQAPLRLLQAEHDAARELLLRLREVTSRYETPAHAPPQTAALYDALSTLDREVTRNIELESEVLFPMLLGG